MVKKSRSGVSAVTKTKLKAQILKQIRQYESATRCKVMAVSFPTGGKRVVRVDTVPLPE